MSWYVHVMSCAVMWAKLKAERIQHWDNEHGVSGMLCIIKTICIWLTGPSPPAMQCLCINVLGVLLLKLDSLLLQFSLRIHKQLNKQITTWARHVMIWPCHVMWCEQSWTLSNLNMLCIYENLHVSMKHTMNILLWELLLLHLGLNLLHLDLNLLLVCTLIILIRLIDYVTHRDHVVSTVRTRCSAKSLIICRMSSSLAMTLAWSSEQESTWCKFDKSIN